jgi:hypothetical protein
VLEIETSLQNENRPANATGTRSPGSPHQAAVSRTRFLESRGTTRLLCDARRNAPAANTLPTLASQQPEARTARVHRDRSRRIKLRKELARRRMLRKAGARKLRKRASRNQLQQVHHSALAMRCVKQKRKRIWDLYWESSREFRCWRVPWLPSGWSARFTTICAALLGAGLQTTPALRPQVFPHPHKR